MRRPLPISFTQCGSPVGYRGRGERGTLKAELEPLLPAQDTLPGEVLRELAADAIEEAGASRAEPIEFEGI